MDSFLAEKYLGTLSAKTLGKGERILDSFWDEITYMMEDDTTWVVDVPSESNHFSYQVTIEEKKTELAVDCECPAYEDYGACKHIAAAVLFLKDWVDVPIEDNEADFEEEESSHITDMPQTLDSANGDGLTIRMPHINFWHVCQLAGNLHPASLSSFSSSRIAVIDKSSAHHRFLFKQDQSTRFYPEIIYNKANEFTVKCTCLSGPSVCGHIVAAFAHIEENYGSYYFNRFRDITADKEAILAKYGLTPGDTEAELFEWGFDHHGKLKAIKQPGFIRPRGDVRFMETLKSELLAQSPDAEFIVKPRILKDTFIDFEVGFVLNFATSNFLNFELETAFVREKRNKKDIKRLNLHKEENWPYLQALDAVLFSKVVKFSEPLLSRWLFQQASSLGILKPSNLIYSEEKNQTRFRRYQFNLLKDIWNDLAERDNVFFLPSGKFSNTNILPAVIKTEPAKLCFKVRVDGKFISVEPFIDIPNENARTFRFLSRLVFCVEDRLFLAENYDMLDALSRFPEGALKFPLADKSEVIKNLVLPLKQKFTVDIDDSLEVEQVWTEPEPRVMLSELNNEFLLLKPQFLYGETLVDYDDLGEELMEETGGLKIVHRNKAREKELYEFLRTLHPRFAGQRNNMYYYLPFTDVMKGAWYLKMIASLQEAEIAVFGLQELKQFKYNVNRPKLSIKAGSGIDWFDLQISAQWGDQVVPFREIRKAVQNEQTAVLLDDGTLGVIPEEWIKQYRLLFKMGDEVNGVLKVSKKHFSLLDELSAELNSEEVIAEIAAKKQRLSQLNVSETIPPSKEIKAELRPYQLAGFQWLQTLDQIGWGGCLADDMGLGKTLQTITFLQYLKEKTPNNTQLVICPTSLIFNWENEIQKFCPGLRYHTYYGTNRSFEDEHFESFDVILTTYGVLRLDLQHLTRFKWDYVILDESQAIKNPHAQITRSVQLLPCNNRLILSGTPVQNNTGDLYAQFNFVNPGLLGSWDFFKREFANDIDRNGDKEKTAQLRKLIYPFLLRRTKEQVAGDLPDKTEMILWCSMSKEQRDVYEEYKNYYRDTLLKRIDEEGIAKAGIYVLEGLLKLRQICDHPSLIKGDAVKTSASVKTDELLREIQENTGEHKLLVFSQFTEMLKKIEQKLNENQISYCYLDGSTTIAQRKKQVDDFQSKPEIKVFLISLQAGGVGLNLTAADYVYLVDPWWNPAAEQQAIDRTHRIGQTKKVFAYKMICKDTIEEKILNLQERKKSLSGDLVSEDAGFVKKLTRNDIEFLFT